MKRYIQLFPEQVKWKTIDGNSRPYSDKNGFKVDSNGNEVEMSDKDKEEEKKRKRKKEKGE